MSFYWNVDNKVVTNMFNELIIVEFTNKKYRTIVSENF